MIFFSLIQLKIKKRNFFVNRDNLLRRGLFTLLLLLKKKKNPPHNTAMWKFNFNYNPNPVDYNNNNKHIQCDASNKICGHILPYVIGLHHKIYPALIL